MMPTWAVVILVLAGALFLVKLLYVLAAGWTLPVTRGALFVTTSSVRIRAFLDAVPMHGSEVFVDLGCGDGRVLRAARRRYGVRAVGFEINLLAYVIARVLGLGVKGVRIRWGNFWSKEIGKANVVFCYLFPDVMERLAGKLENELGPGARVVSCNFPLPGWHPEKVLRPESSRHGDPIFVYQFPDACRKEKGVSL
ncbi:MAG: class I SAM-dependent methyltransferase [Deltaproteobacteria bacterium]|nr:class I SAM-dependent methyltransferase [Deltaproteobacteria bacterium]